MPRIKGFDEIEAELERHSGKIAHDEWQNVARIFYDIYQKNRTDDLAVAIIQNGTKDNEEKVIGTISTISKLVNEKQIKSPAIIVIGEVVKRTFKTEDYFRAMNSEDEFVQQNLDLDLL